MPISPFKLERYFAEHEFKLEFLLSPSDCEGLAMEQLLHLASPEGLRLWKELKLGYTESQGHPRLRAEVAGLYQDLDPGQVLIAAPEEAIFIAMQTLLEPGDAVVAISPAYQSLHEIAHWMGCSLTPWTLRLGTDGWQLDIDQLESCLSARTRLLVINFPHNPTGYIPSRSELEAILTLARRRDLYVFSDEMYRLLEYDPSMRLPPVCDLYEKGISLSGLSKAFALPGLRVGWLAARQPAWMERWLIFKDYTTICNSAPGEILGMIALQARETILTRNLEIIRNNLEAAERFFADHRDSFTWIRPLAGSVAFPQWRGEGSVEEFCQELISKRGVMLVPGSLFDFPGNHFRIGLGRKNFSAALERLGEHIGTPGLKIVANRTPQARRHKPE